MSQYEITASPTSINFSPASTEEEIIQNVATIINTRKGTVPLDREFGLSWDALSAPPSTAKAILTAEVIKQIQKYEPRAKVIKITFDKSQAIEGQLIPRVTIGVNQ